ncbi:hypothetical protein F4859DRAFT_500136, partial [Xylaria cf. heliscus]
TVLYQWITGEFSIRFLPMDLFLFYKHPTNDGEPQNRLAAVQCDILCDDHNCRALFVNLLLPSGVHCFLNGKKCNA